MENIIPENNVMKRKIFLENIINLIISENNKNNIDLLWELKYIMIKSSKKKFNTWINTIYKNLK